MPLTLLDSASTRNQLVAGDVVPSMQVIVRSSVLMAFLLAGLIACTGGDSAPDTASDATQPSQSVSQDTSPDEPEQVQLRGAVVARRASCIELKTSDGRFALLDVPDTLLPGALVIVRGRPAITALAACTGTPFKVASLHQIGVQGPEPQPPSD